MGASGAVLGRIFEVFELFEYIVPNITNEYSIRKIFVNRILFEYSNILLQVLNSDTLKNHYIEH